MSKRLYIGNLKTTVTEDDLRRVFSKFGEIVEVSIKAKGDKMNYGFVEYTNLDDADKAQNVLQDYELQGSRIRVEFTRGPKYATRKEVHKNKKERTNYRVEVTHLPRDCSWQDLKDYMSTVGPVGYCNIRGDYGVVEFLHYDDMKRAVRKLDDTKLKSRDSSSYIHVYNCYRSHHHHRRHRSYSYSDSYSPSRSSSSSYSRSRSRSRSKSYDDKKKDRSVSKSNEQRKDEDKMSESPRKSVERSVSRSKSSGDRDASRSYSRHSSSRSH